MPNTFSSTAFIVNSLIIIIIIVIIKIIIIIMTIVIIMIIIIIIIFIEDINFTDKWFTKESSKIKKEQKGKIKTNIWIYKN